MTGETKSRRPEGRRLVLLGLIGGSVVYLLAKIALAATSPIASWGSDYDWVMGQAHRILSGGEWYPAWEKAGPFVHGDAVWADLYPPTTVLFLFLPLSLAGGLAWWTIPLLIIAWVLAYHQPSLEGWAVIAAIAAFWPATWTSVQIGNPTMWMVAFLGLGTMYRWPAAFLLLKPTLAPFALIGAGNRGWWVVVLVFVASLMVLSGPWLEYAQVIANMRGFGLTYSFHDLPFLSIPLIAWMTGRHWTPIRWPYLARLTGLRRT